MSGIDRRRFLRVLPSTAAIALLAGSRSTSSAADEEDEDVSGEWIYLSDLEWDSASTGWLGVANQQIPALDSAFHGGRLALGDMTYERGIGVYPLSEIIYTLDGDCLELAADIGLDNAAQGADCAVRFFVFVDGVLRFQSGYMRPGDPPTSITVDLRRAHSLRLVVDAPLNRAKGAFADWAGVRLFRLANPPPPATPAPIGARTDSAGSARFQGDDNAVSDRGRKLIASLPAALRRLRTADERPGSHVDRAANRLWLSTGRVALGVNLSRPTFAALTLLDLQTQWPVVLDAGSAVILDQRYALTSDGEAVGRRPFEIEPVDDPTLGAGLQITLHCQTRNQRAQIDVRYFLYASDIGLYDMVVRQSAADSAAVQFQHVNFEPERPSLWVDSDVQYLSDFSRLRYGHLYDDGIQRREPIGEGKPLFVWSDRRRRGLLMALLDHTNRPTYFRAQAAAAKVQASWGLTSGAVARDGSRETRSARLFMQITRTADVRQAFNDLRKMLDKVAPEAPMPAWFKFQWLSWYIYGMGNDAEAVQRQGDYIAANLSDLGPWNLLIDAGWYISEGRPQADWRATDLVKFPGGMRPLVDRLHAQGLWVVLYLSVPYIDSIEQSGYWLGMRRIIEEHPDWLHLLGGDEWRQSYSFDFTLPGVRQYWSDVMEDFFSRYDVDGIKIDGVGNAEGAILSPEKLDAFGLVDEVNEQTMDIYRFFYAQATQRRDDAYIETGWLTPIFARPLVHTFRYGDEAPRFSSPYPFPGLVEHIDYAIIQKEILGLRPNMGAIFDNPNDSAINRWWLEAGLALGTHVTLGFDLAGMTGPTLSMYRSLLAHYEPFSGATTYGAGLRPRSFATARAGTTYLGVLNRNRSERTIPVLLADHGIDLNTPATAYDVEQNRFLRLARPFVATLAARSFRLFVVRQTPGMLWTNSSFTTREENGRLIVTLRGPAGLAGFAHLLAPRPARVQLDGVRLSSMGATSYTYDEATAVLSLVYENDPEGRLLVITYAGA